MKKKKLMEIINQIDTAHKKREREMEKRESLLNNQQGRPVPPTGYKR